MRSKTVSISGKDRRVFPVQYNCEIIFKMRDVTKSYFKPYCHKLVMFNSFQLLYVVGLFFSVYIFLNDSIQFSTCPAQNALTLTSVSFPHC